MARKAINDNNLNGISHNSPIVVLAKRCSYNWAIFFSLLTTSRERQNTNNAKQKSELLCKLYCKFPATVPTYARRLHNNDGSTQREGRV